MYKVLLLSKIADEGLECLDKSKYIISDNEQNPDAILVRPTSMHEMEFSSNMLAIGRAGIGVNNIPIDRCSEKGIVVFNTPGANANAVKELVIATLILVSRDVIGGVNWTQKLIGDDVLAQVEKGKTSFMGTEISGKTLGIIGLGMIGGILANSAMSLGMNVIGFDPYLSDDAKLDISCAINIVDKMDEIFVNSDYISVHIPLNESTHGIINKKAFDKIHKGVRLLNFSRGEIVDIHGLKAAICEGKVLKYATDFPSIDMLGNEAIIPIPHLGASTLESEENCAKMVAIEISDYLENGNISNSVNYPNCTLNRSGAFRIAVLHKNTSNILGQISSCLTDCGLNIIEIVNKSRGIYACTLANVEGDTTNVMKNIGAIEEVIRVRVI